MPLWHALRFRARGWGEAFCRSPAWKRLQNSNDSSENARAMDDAERKKMRTFAAIAIACCALASGARSQVMITRNNSQLPSTGSADNFTGSVRILGSFQRTAPARVSG